MSGSPVLFSDDDDFSDDYSIRISDIKLDLTDKSVPSTSTAENSHIYKREQDPIYLEMIKPRQRADIFTRREVAPARESFNPYVEMEFLRPADMNSRPPRPFHTPDGKRRPSTPNSILCHQRRRERQLQEIYADSYKQRDNDDTDGEYHPVIDGHRYFSPNVTPGKSSSTDCNTPVRSLRKRRKARWSTIDSDSEDELCLLDLKQKMEKTVTDRKTPIKPAIRVNLLGSRSPLSAGASRTPVKPYASNKPSDTRVILTANPLLSHGNRISEMDVISTDEDDRLIMDDILTDDNDENAPPNLGKILSAANQSTAAHEKNDEFANFSSCCEEVARSSECSPSRKTPTRKCRDKTLSFIKKMLLHQDPSPNSPEKPHSRKRPSKRLSFTDKLLDDDDDTMLAELLPLRNKRMRIE